MNCPPDAGGVNDQDYTTIHRMAVLSNIYNALSHMRNLPGNSIHSLSTSERNVLRYLKDMGMIFHA